jgi:aryl-alcohol dehydrogenase-like predicted oxidoreductase
MGRLTGKYSAANPPPKGRKYGHLLLLAKSADTPRFGGSLTWEQMDPLLTEMKSLAEKYDVPMSAIALNWVICKGAIPLGGARNAEQAEQVSYRDD